MSSLSQVYKSNICLIRINQNLKFNGKDVSSFKIDISDANGRSLKYDSKTQALTSGSTSSSNNKGELFGISKLLTLIVMIYLL